MTVTPIANRDQLHRLVDDILNPARAATVTVFSVDDATRRPSFDLDAYAQAVAGLAVKAYLLTDPDDGREFTRLAGLDCYDGAACLSPARARARTIVPRHPGAEQYLIDRTIRDTPTDKTPERVDTVTENRRLREENRRLRERLRRTGRPRKESPIPPADAYPEDMPEEWATLAVQVAWAYDTNPNDKHDRLLPARWNITRTAAEAIRDAPAPMDCIRCIIRILTGTDRKHPLSTNGNGSRPAVGPYGNLVHRAYVKANSPNAWRIHYTRDRHGDITILAAGGHDDLI